MRMNVTCTAVNLRTFSGDLVKLKFAPLAENGYGFAAHQVVRAVVQNGGLIQADACVTAKTSLIRSVVTTPK